MLDFNTKKEILRKLQKKGAKNVFMRVLCVIAALFVKIWYGIGCRISMVFSDKNGNLFGIKGLGKKQTERKKSRREDDIVYVKKPFFGRLLSAVLAFSFVMMVLPELGVIDLGFSASAADIDASQNVTDADGKVYHHNPDVSDPYLVFLADEYDAARKHTISSLSYKIGYGSIAINWTFNLPLDDTRGFYVRVVTESGQILNGNGNGEIIQHATSVTYTGLTTTEKVRVDIYPITYLNQWIYTKATYKEDGTIDTPASFDDYSGGRTDRMYEVRGALISSTDNGGAYRKLDATFDPPDVSIQTSTADGTLIDSKKADIENNIISLTWHEAVQVGGHPDDDGKATATGYRIYMSTDNGPFSYVQTVPGLTAEISAAPGHYYQFFVEAYRYAWDPPRSASTWNTSHPGLISSSSGNEALSDDSKASTIYTKATKVRAEAYVAPAKPSMTVSANNKTYEIDIQVSPSSGSYSGVYIFRSEGVDPISEDEVKANYPNYDGNFGKWLHDNCIMENTSLRTPIVYIDDKLISGNNTRLTFTDKKDNIKSGVIYCYYAVSFLDKGNGNYLYGTTVTIARGSLDLSLDEPLITDITTDHGQITLTWNKVDGADGYEIEVIKLDSFTNHDDDETNDDIVPRYIYSEDERAEAPPFNVGNITSHTFIRLYDSDRYQYRVRAYKSVKAQGSGGGETPKFYGGWSQSAAISVYDYLPAPENISATTVDGAITVKWNPVPKADRYTVYWTNLTTGETGSRTLTGTTFNHTNLINGERYTYYVVAYKDINGDGSHGLQTIDSGAENSSSITIKVGAELNIPQDLTATTTDGQVTVSWKKVTGAQGYILERRKPGEAWDFVESLNVGTDGRSDDLEGLTKTYTMLTNGDTYEYRVRAYKTVSGERVYSDPCTPVSIVVGVPLDAPRDLTVTTTDNSATLKWTASKGASGYIVHAINGSTHLEFDVSKTQFTHTGLDFGDEWVYYVEAYKNVNGKPFFSAPSARVPVTIGTSLDAPRDLTVTTTDGAANLKWTATKGAEGYIVYASSGITQREFDVSKPQYNHTGLLNGSVWSYYVKAYKTVNGKRVFSPSSEQVTVTIGSELAAPKDFTVTTTDGVANLKWTAVTGAQGYIVYARSSNGQSYQFDVSRPQYTHSNLINGETWTYYVVAYKNVSGSMVYSNPTQSVTVRIGVSMAAPIDLTATASNRRVDLKWTAVTGAQGYVVYLYNEDTMEYDPIAVTSKPTYTHLGLKNGIAYTYMVAAFKNINGTRVYGEYSMPVTAIPTSGSTTDIDRELTIKGTAPYGISHGEYISAGANHGAFDESVDVYFTTSADATNAVRDVLKGYANGLSSFIIYPFDISIYKENTLIKIDPNRGYSVTITMPIPDRLIAYRDYITVIHINEDADMEYITDVEWLDYTDRRLEVLPCAVLDIDNVWCIQFECTNFSPFAIVIYKDHLSDVSAGGGIMDGIFAGNFNSGVLLFTALPDILPNNKKLKIVSGGKKRYRIKSIEKRDV